MKAFYQREIILKHRRVVSATDVMNVACIHFYQHSMFIATATLNSSIIFFLLINKHFTSNIIRHIDAIHTYNKLELCNICTTSPIAFNFSIGMFIQ